MAKREEEMKEIRANTTEEINEEIVDLKGKLFMLWLQKSQRNELKSNEFRCMRKRVGYDSKSPLSFISLLLVFLLLDVICLGYSTSTDSDEFEVIRLVADWN